MSSITGLATLKPPEMITAIGCIICLLSIFAYLGISGLGIQVGGSHTEEAPWYAMAIGLFMTWGGAREFRLREQANRRQSEPTEGDEFFLEEFLKHEPITAVNLRNLSTEHDRSKPDDALMATLAHLRTEGWINRGKIVHRGNRYFAVKNG